MMRPALAAGLLSSLALAGCSGGSSTALLVHLALEPGQPAPQQIVVSVYDVHHALVLQRPTSATGLPGTLRIGNLPDVDQTLRVVVLGSGGAGRLLDGSSVSARARQQVELSLTLSSATRDSDGDGVPEGVTGGVDNCPGAANLDQLDSDGNGVGDACQADGGVEAGVDAGADAGDGGVLVASKCATAGGLLCDGFEAGLIDGNLWSVTMQSGKTTASIDNLHVKRGAGALHLHLGPAPASPVNPYQADITNSTIFAGGPNPIFLRAFVYIAPPLIPVGTNFLRAQSGGPNYSGMLLLYQGSAHLEALTYNFAPPGFDNSALTAKVHAGDPWMCVEWMMRSDVPDGGAASQVWLDDQSVDDITASGIAGFPAFVDAIFGIELDLPANSPAMDVWYDEIMIDTQRIGCAR